MPVLLILLIGFALRMIGSWRPTLIFFGAVACDLTANALFANFQCVQENSAKVGSVYDLGIQEIFINADDGVCDENCLFDASLGIIVHKMIRGVEYRISIGESCGDPALFTNMANFIAGLAPGKCYMAEVEPLGQYEYRTTLRRSSSFLGRVQTETETVERRKGDTWTPISVFGKKTISTITPIAWLLTDIDRTSCAFSRNMTQE